MTKTVQQKKKSTKKITLSEFRAWLSGVEEMQKLDWFPSAEQWQTIRDKINLIEEQKTQNFNQGMSRQEPARPVDNTSNFNRHPDVNRFGDSYLPGPEQLMPNIQMTPELQAKYLEIQKNPSLPGLSQGGDRIKTPDIDTGNGLFSSSFE